MSGYAGDAAAPAVASNGDADKPEVKRRARRPRGPLYVVEHMEEGLEDWCRLEYRHMCQFIGSEQLVFLRWPKGLSTESLQGACPKQAGTEAPMPRFVEESFETLMQRAAGEDGPAPLPSLERVCLLDMEAEEALEPPDAAKFDAVVFGGILGNIHERDDGSYGSDDRTAEIRSQFAHRRHLGPMQMTTDTAMLVSKMVLEEARFLSDIPFLDSPEITGGATEGGEIASDCVCMEGFRYVGRRGADGDWEPTLPEGMKELLIADADKDILDEL
eukprot:TRINITY_DN12217_c0_g1_i1.p1 TRINITY_DN12217_c0_g1~~TRINITY_DN12217_c0_g1_i1.p1  ORF type:complete len:273 (+),score=74.93 TRINITY_DN12217_c0_g1_i1:138-956(+)